MAFVRRLGLALLGLGPSACFVLLRRLCASVSLRLVLGLLCLFVCPRSAMSLAVYVLWTYSRSWCCYVLGPAVLGGYGGITVVLVRSGDISGL